MLDTAASAPKILLVDDEPSIRQLLSYRLHSLIHIAPEGQVAALSWLYSLAMLALFALLAAAATARIGARRSR